MLKNWLKQTGQEILAGLKRFYFAYFYAIVLTFVILYFIENRIDEKIVFKIIASLAIAFVGAINFRIAREVRNIKCLYEILFNIVLVSLLVFIFFVNENQKHDSIYYRYLLTIFALLILVFLIPYIFDKNQDDKLWNYSYLLILKTIVINFFTGIVYTGIVVAYLAFVELLEIEHWNNFYAYSITLIFGFFSAPLLLAWIPKDFEQSSEKYPVFLKILGLYIILPLTIVYFAILYIYFFKIIAQWQIPRQIVSMLVISFSSVGILNFFVLYPLRNVNFVKIFYKIFYWAIFPLIALLFISISKRINQYGITEIRYFGIILGIWLLFVAIYGLFKKLNTIKFIPLSLLIVVIIANFGPLSAFQISKNSQIRRLKNEIANLPQDSIQIINDTIFVGTKKYYEIDNIVRYIWRTYGQKPFVKHFGIKPIEDSLNISISYEIMNRLKIKLSNKLDSNSLNYNHYISLYCYSKVFDIADYDKIYLVDIWQQGSKEIGDSEFEIKDGFLVIMHNKDTVGSFNIGNMLRDKSLTMGELTLDQATLYYQNNRVKSKLIIENLGGYSDNKDITIRGFWMIKFLEEK